jgi:hypothetical protein
MARSTVCSRDLQAALVPSNTASADRIILQAGSNQKPVSSVYCGTAATLSSMSSKYVVAAVAMKHKADRTKPDHPMTTTP